MLFNSVIRSSTQPPEEEEEEENWAKMAKRRKMERQKEVKKI
jgi:hypothetical protein